MIFKLHFKKLISRYIGKSNEREYKELRLCLTKELAFQGVRFFSFSF